MRVECFRVFASRIQGPSAPKYSIIAYTCDCKVFVIGKHLGSYLGDPRAGMIHSTYFRPLQRWLQGGCT